MTDAFDDDTRSKASEPRTGIPDTSAWVAKTVGFVVGFIFLGIGLTVLIAMWIPPFGTFGSPPLFFRVVTSFIAIAFVTVGGGVSFAAITGRIQSQLPAKALREASRTPSSIRQGDVARANFVCPQCGAPLDDRADVSPHGDVKCVHCNGWFNIHKK